MSVVVTLQVLVGALAVLLLLQAWLCRHQLDHDAAGEIGFDGFVEFHPELMIRWDDEARDCRTPVRTRGVTRCERGRATPAGSPSAPASRR